MKGDVVVHMHTLGYWTVLHRDLVGAIEDDSLHHVEGAHGDTQYLYTLI